MLYVFANNTSIALNISLNTLLIIVLATSVIPLDPCNVMLFNLKQMSTLCQTKT